ncbi:DUF4249 domain-containing protein [Niastella populi]|uniref:DUF4249 domain-containing protein n=1 Tax=Niastella populi TaxID=550983 RepID=A0A1V9FK49_9BACT|nr:DUF4249 domain-containing protein [Niastella populi]OQP58739.1 hypothetical protein A4R26_22495 [Niastella populi]
MHARHLLIILITLTITGCEKIYDIPIPEESNKMVLNLIMNKDSIMMARVTLSGRMNGLQDMQEIPNAKVRLFENGTFKETLEPFNSSFRTYYRSNTVPRAGATYRVTAAAPGYPEVSGSDQIPDTVQVGEIKMTVAQINSWQAKATVSVQLHDDPAVQNYYRVRLYLIREWVDANGNGGRQKIEQYFEVEEANLSLFTDATSNNFFTTDALFNGRSPRFIFRANTDGAFKKMLVEITSLSQNSYNYLNSTFMAQEKNEDGFSEKVIVFNNIQNGFGIVGGVAQREYLLVR